MPTQLEKQNEILSKMKELDLETYREIFPKLSANEFAELYYRMQEVLGAGAEMAMPPVMLNKYTELFWMVNEIFQKHVSSERKAYVMEIRNKTEEEVMQEFVAQQQIATGPKELQ